MCNLRCSPLGLSLSASSLRLGFYLPWRCWLAEQSREDVEGTLFVVRRTDFPKFRVVVLNRVGLDNHMLDINPGFTFELSPPYLMYQEEGEGGGVKGVWFYDEQEANAIAGLLTKIADTLNAAAARRSEQREARKKAAAHVRAQKQTGTAAQAQAAAQAAQAGQPQAETQREQQEAEAPVAAAGEAQDITLLLQKMAAGSGRQEKPEQAAPAPQTEELDAAAEADDGGDNTFMALLQKAGPAPPAAAPVQKPATSAKVATAAASAKAATSPARAPAAAPEAAPAVTPAVISKALHELAEDGAFVARIAAAINRHT